ncbi:MAG: dipeptidase [Bryobacteraceae bacterium]|nr:dipeptidase [Bryobacteraceae bacterium]
MLVLFLLLAAPVFAQDRMDRIMRDLLIFDAHIDTPRYVVDEGYQFAEKHSYYELDIPRMKEGNLGAVFFGVYVQPQDVAQELWVERALEVIDAFHEEVRRNGRDMETAYTADDVVRIRKAGKRAALLSLEGGHIILDSLGLLRNFFRLGVRYMTLAHFRTNNWADSMTDVAVHNGLSDFGRDVVREMNRLGMVVDVSHISDKAVLDAVEASRAPVIASHSSVKAITPIARNMPDNVIRAIAAKGGVVCINFHAGYLSEPAYNVYIRNRPARDAEIKTVLDTQRNNPRRWEMVRAIQKRYFELMPKVDMKELLRHIDHIAKLVGADHVGLGSDYDGISGMTPVGMEDVSRYPAIVKGLIAMGYSDDDIRKIMGGNLLRVMRANEAVAAK